MWQSMKCMYEMWLAGTSRGGGLQHGSAGRHAFVHNELLLAVRWFPYSGVAQTRYCQPQRRTTDFS
jgi:hypothetical protein